MATHEEIKATPTADEGRAIATITVAFINDPVVRWVFRDPDRYLTFWPKFVKAFAGGAFKSGTADSIDDFGGVALWLPPGVEPDEETIGAILMEAIPEAEHEEVFALLEQMGEFHPTDRHWYLPLIGVDVTKHGRRHGTALLSHALDRCDGDGLPAYLEATSPLNKALYERHGFEDFGVMQVGSSPPMWPMLRRPRAA